MTKTNGLFRDLAASIIANTPVEQFLFSPPDKAKHLKELSEQMPSEADIKRQQAPAGTMLALKNPKYEADFGLSQIQIRKSPKSQQESEKSELKRRTAAGKSEQSCPVVLHPVGG